MNSKSCHSIRFSWTIDRFSSLSNVVQKKITQSGERNTVFEIALVYSVSSSETHDIDVELRRLDTQKCPTEIVCKTRIENHWGKLIRKNREVVVLDPYNDSRIVLSSSHPLMSDEGLVMLPYDKLVLQCVLKVKYCCEHPDQLHGLVSVASDDAKEEPGTSFQEVAGFGIQRDLEAFLKESKSVFRYESEAGIQEVSQVPVLVDSGTDVQEEFYATLKEGSDACIESVSGIQNDPEVDRRDVLQDYFQKEHKIFLGHQLDLSLKEEPQAGVLKVSDAVIQSVSGIQNIAELLFLEEPQDNFQEEPQAHVQEEKDFHLEIIE